MNASIIRSSPQNRVHSSSRSAFVSPPAAATGCLQRPQPRLTAKLPCSIRRIHRRRPLLQRLRVMLQSLQAPLASGACPQRGGRRGCRLPRLQVHQYPRCCEHCRRARPAGRSTPCTRRSCWQLPSWPPRRAVTLADRSRQEGLSAGLAVWAAGGCGSCVAHD